MWLPACSELIYISQSVAAWKSHIMLQIVTFWANSIYPRHICEKSPLKKALGAFTRHRTTVLLLRFSYVARIRHLSRFRLDVSPSPAGRSLLHRLQNDRQASIEHFTVHCIPRDTTEQC